MNRVIRLVHYALHALLTQIGSEVMAEVVVRGFPMHVLWATELASWPLFCLARLRRFHHRIRRVIIDCPLGHVVHLHVALRRSGRAEWRFPAGMAIG